LSELFDIDCLEDNFKTSHVKPHDKTKDLLGRLKASAKRSKDRKEERGGFIDSKDVEKQFIGLVNELRSDIALAVEQQDLPVISCRRVEELLDKWTVSGLPKLEKLKKKLKKRSALGQALTELE